MTDGRSLRTRDEPGEEPRRIEVTPEMVIGPGKRPGPTTFAEALRNLGDAFWRAGETIRVSLHTDPPGEHDDAVDAMRYAMEAMQRDYGDGEP